MVVLRVDGDGAKKLKDALQQLENKKVSKIGWFEGSKYPEAPNTPVAYVATIQEFGYAAKNIPPRPFMRPTISEKQSEWRDILIAGVKNIFKGSETAISVLEITGLKIEGDIRKTISLIVSPPLKPSTIRARLRKRANKKHVGNLTKPLIDTGLMYGTLTSKVEDE